MKHWSDIYKASNPDAPINYILDSIDKEVVQPLEGRIRDLESLINEQAHTVARLEIENLCLKENTQ